MTLRQTTLTKLWQAKLKKQQPKTKCQLDQRQSFHAHESLNSNTMSRSNPKAHNKQESRSNIQSVNTSSLVKKIEKDTVKVDKIENRVSERFRMRLKQLICNLSNQRAKKNGESTASNTTQQQKYDSQNKRSLQSKTNDSRQLEKYKVQTQKSILQQISTTYKMNKQEMLRQKKRMKDAMPSVDYHKTQQIIVNQHIQNSQIRFMNGFQYRICQSNGLQNNCVWLGANEIMKLNPHWLLEYFSKFI